MSKQNKETHFGFSSVAWEEKEKKVNAVFESVASNYDLMNNVMSLGIHHLWKWLTIQRAAIQSGQQVLDLAGGSGDLTQRLSEKVGSRGRVVLADINAAMLAVGRNRMLDAGLSANIDFVQANAETLPFVNNRFHCIIMGFGLRNVTNQSKALHSMYRVCKPGGKLIILEFSQPVIPGFKTLYDWYSFAVLPKLGRWIANDEASYRYLAESIRMHPPQEGLKKIIEQAGFEDCHYTNLSGGIVAVHIAYKY